MVNNKKAAAMDMTNGPMLKQIILFIIPLILTRLLQVCFSSADTAVIGRCVGDLALAAVGASSVIMSVVYWISGGMSGGVSVVVAQDVGRNNEVDIRKAIHSSVIMGGIVGLLLMAVGLAVSRFSLIALGTPEDILENALLYFRIVLGGVPAMMVYQFSAAAMRAVGDTGKPVFFLALSGAVNLVLNLFTVIVLKWAVLGVALATAVTQYLSAFLILRYMAHRNDRYSLSFNELKLSGDKVKGILKIGIPAALQGVLFSISDIAIQTAVNTMGSLAVSGNTVALTVDGYVFMSMESLTQACMVFSGQNVGAKLYDRSKKAIRLCISVSTVLGIVVGLVVFTFRKALAGLFLPDSPQAVAHAVGRLSIVTTTCFIYGILDNLSAGLRSYGSSVIPAVISVVGISGFRVLWVLLYFPTHKDMFNLYLCYPLAWIICIVFELTALFLVIRQKIQADTEIPAL